MIRQGGCDLNDAPVIVHRSTNYPIEIYRF